MPRKFIFNILIFVVMCGGVTSTLVRVPSNKAVIQGSAVTFDCSTNVNTGELLWLNDLCYISGSISSCRQYFIYNGGALTSNFPPRFKVTEVNNATHITRDLSINPTQLTDAGVYLCAELVPGVARRNSSSAQLIVLANHTRCSTNLSSSRAVQENDVIVMTCSITYSGNWAPVMRWFNSVTRHNFTDDVIALTTSDTTVTSQLTVAAAALHGCQIVCVTYFTQHSPALPTSATNIPSYTHEWTSLTLDVRYAPRDLQINPKKSNYQAGDKIRCSAEGNPKPSIQWRDLVNGTVIQGAVLVVSDDILVNNYTFQCIASNEYNGEKHTITYNITLTDKATTSNDDNITLIAGIVGGVVGFLLVIIIIVVVVIVLRKRRKKCGSEDKQLESRSEATTPSPEPNGHSAQRPTQDGEATTKFQTPEESPYDEVVARPGPVPRPRPPGGGKKNPAQPEPTYAAIDHNQKLTSK